MLTYKYKNTSHIGLGHWVNVLASSACRADTYGNLIVVCIKIYQVANVNLLVQKRGLLCHTVPVPAGVTNNNFCQMLPLLLQFCL